MTDYIKTLEAQNLEIREENESFRYLFQEPNTHKEIWHVDGIEYVYCKDGTRKPFLTTMPFFSPQLAFIRFAFDLKACKDVEYTEDASYIFSKDYKGIPS